MKPFGLVAKRSAPINDSTVLSTRAEIRENELAEKIKKEIARVNIRDVLALRGLCASMFLMITWWSLLSLLQQVLILHQRRKRSRYSKRRTQMNVIPRITIIRTMFKSMNIIVNISLAIV